jgi:hypothetical protein
MLAGFSFFGEKPALRLALGGLFQFQETTK